MYTQLFSALATTLAAAVNVRAQSTTSLGFGNPIGSGSITFQSPTTVVETCERLPVQWTYTNSDVSTGIQLQIIYTNEGVNQEDGALNGTGPDVGDIVTNVITDEAFAENRLFGWEAVTIPEPGWYLFYGYAENIRVFSSSAFRVAIDDVSCLALTTSTSGTISPSASATNPTSSESPTTTLIADPPSSSSNKSNVGAIVGGVVGAIVFVVLVGAWILYRRKQKGGGGITSVGASKRSGHRKWGGLASVDTHKQTPAPSKVYGGAKGSPPLPYTHGTFAQSRVDDDAIEKGSPTTEGHAVDPLNTLPALSHSPRSPANRYSGALYNNAAHNNNSGLAQFNHSRSASLKADAFLDTTSPTSTEDPFQEATFRHRAHRSSSLSLPSTAHPSPRSDMPPLPSPNAPYATLGNNSRPTSGRIHGSTSSTGVSSLNRSQSGNALARPARKPVPQYDASIEMTHTTTPTQSHPGPGMGIAPSPSNSLSHLGSLTNESNGALASSVDSMSPWLQDRAPVASRNIGLAGQQGEGPVHYLMPDLPPPQRN